VTASAVAVRRNASPAEPALRTADLDYHLPPELIAQAPLAKRDASRLLVLDRSRSDVIHATIRDLPKFLRPGDLLVANDSRVLPARLRAVKPETGGKVELLLLRREADGTWTALAKPSRRLRAGLILRLVTHDGSASAEARVAAIRQGGEIAIELPAPVEASLEDWGEVPLPPYVRRRLDDPERYQTVFARTIGSAAAPTAGLHFTGRLIDQLRARDVAWTEVTLHVGLDTFRPVTTERLEEHEIHQEWCTVPEATAQQIAATRRNGGRVVAVGTTSARTLETLGRDWDDERPHGFAGMTGIYILPGHDWRLVDGLLTNFHLPRTTLLAMVCALAGWDRIRAAYKEAIAERYRFYSFGDAMLIL
jgi:S-adenosylmethionine:tRNA ribosyltransferase-isomerase